MATQSMAARYGLFACPSCSGDEPSDDCGDSCSLPWPDELSELDYWPACKCCGRPAHLLEALVSHDAARLA
jgi:hypothetical protein